MIPDDPIAAAAALAGRPGRVLLHSGRDDDERGRWSFVACDPVETIAGRDLDELERFAARHGADLRDTGAGAPPEPRVIGTLGYEGDYWFGAYRAVARWPAHGPGEVIGPDAPRLAALLREARAPGRAPAFGELRADDAEHPARVARILEYIRAGDVYQVNLARRLVAPVLADGDALALYRALDAAAPAPYAGLLETDTVRIVSGSPECFLSRAPGAARIETRPIKGTRPRSADPALDRAAAAALAADPKDAAEHVMIVDLERNDLGRVATIGSVRVDRFGYLVELPHLHHKVSTVSAELRPGVGLAELLRATFPGGSITGAPKIRAMQIIRELEPVARGPYCGALGYLGAGGALELAIAIRIAVLHAAELHVHVGGGIVADSDPAAELAETEDKAAGWRRALRNLAA